MKLTTGLAHSLSEFYAAAMTTATGNVAPLRQSVDLAQAQAAIAAEVRAEMARQQVGDTEIAMHLKGKQQWFNRRKHGIVPFSAAELAGVAAYLGVDVAQFYGRAMAGPGPDGGSWAPRGSNPEPTDYKSALLLVEPPLCPVIDLTGHRVPAERTAA